MLKPNMLLQAGATHDPDHALISSARVEGTPVFDPGGHRLGVIHSLMIHKTSGQVAYALLSFGGFLGLGRHVHPIPWEMLDYRGGGYIVSITREQIEAAPRLDLDAAARPREAEETMYRYWDTAPYW